MGNKRRETSKPKGKKNAKVVSTRKKSGDDEESHPEENGAKQLNDTTTSGKEKEDTKKRRNSGSSTLPQNKKMKALDDASGAADSVTQNVVSEVVQKKRGRKKKESKDHLKEEAVDDVKDEEDVSQGDTETESKKSAASKKSKAIKGELVPRPIKYESLGEGPPPVPSTGKMYVGCHVSGAGGLWNAFDNRDECKAKSFALFLRNQRQWLAKPLDQGTVDKWCKALKDMPPHLILPHGSYLMNLGSPVPETLEKSRGMLLEEIQRCEKLGIPHFNFHPGSTLGKCSREECCKTIAESINFVADQTKNVIFVLENMSFQGYTIGGDFHELRTIIEHVKDKTRVGVCIDTCHAHAAGYDLGTEAGFESLVEDFGKIIGWQFLRGLHVNDSKGESGDHLDRHETIGAGTIGKKGFSRIMNCKYFLDLPIILETPWTSNSGYAAEIKLLESLVV